MLEPSTLRGRASTIRLRTDLGVLMSLKKLGLNPLGRRSFLKASMMAAAGATLTDRSLAQSLSPVTKARAAEMRVWSDQPAFTTLFANEKESSSTSDVYDGVWAGDPVPSLPRVPHPSPTVKRWRSAEGEDYLDEETNAATKGKYPNPVRIWEAEQYPIGNGRLAASIFLGSGRDRYSLNEVSFWSGGRNPGTINSKGDKHFDGENGPEIGEDGFGGYQPIGDLLVDFHAPPEKASFLREICLDQGLVRGTATRNGVRIESTAFASHPDQVIVLRYRAQDRQKFDATVSIATQGKTDTVSASQQELNLSRALGNGMRASMRAVISSDAGKQTGEADHIALHGVTSLTIVVAIETNFLQDFQKNWRGEEPVAKLSARLAKVSGLSYDELLRRHSADYEPLFDRVRLHLGSTNTSLDAFPTARRLAAYRENPNDPGLEETIFNFGRYLMISTSRPGSLPAGLQGIWNGMAKAPWGNDYHSNINFQMVYWLPEAANLSDSHLAMIEYLWSTREPNRMATREYLEAIGNRNPQTDGWLVYTSHNPFGGNGWQMNLTGSAWYALHMWEHYAFTGNVAYLRDRAYPMMKELSQYWAAHLKTLGEGGQGFESEYKQVDVSLYPELARVKKGTLVVPNGWSPEHGPRGEDGVAIDQEIVSELFLNTIKAAEILGVDQAWVAELKQREERLYRPQIGKQGNLMEWMIDRDPVTDHRHTSHLFAVFPGSTISIEKTPALAEAARQSLLMRKTTGDSRRSWSWTWRCMLWARLYDGRRAHEMLAGLITWNMLDNLFTTHHIPLQIDGNYGIAAAMIEMLVQSHNGVIHLLPAPCPQWPKGSIRGAKARPNVTVTMSWRNGAVTEWRLASPEPVSIEVLVNGERKKIVPDRLES
jgi:alpha-L-fucosidase 2